MPSGVVVFGAKRSEPWILHLSLLRPHPPWIASEPWNCAYDPAHLPPPLRRTTPAEESKHHPWLAHQLSLPLYCAPDDDKKLNRFRAVYFGMMSEVDENLGRLFAHLKREGLWDDTLIVFTSDHGEQLGDHWLLGKCGYFDQSYAVPLIVRDPRPDAARGSTVSHFTEHVDIMPTLLAFIGADTPPQCDGSSLLPFLESRVAPAWRAQVHWEYDFRDVGFPEGAEQALGLTLHQCNLTVIRDEAYKYVHFANLPPLLFDLKNDPGEFKNLAQNPDGAGVALAYAQKLLSWRMAHEDQTLTHKMASNRGMLERPAPRF